MYPQKLTSVSLRALGLTALLAFMLPAAQAEDTVDRILRTKTVNIGVRDGVAPFSMLDANGKGTGYSVEMCNKVVELMRKEMKLPDLRTREVQVSAANRFEKIKDGSIDIECTMTSNVRSRTGDFDFSYAVQFGAQRFLTHEKSGIRSQNDLAGKSIAVVKGTAGEKIMQALQKTDFPTLKIVPVANNIEALKALDEGQAQAVLQMDLLLANLRLKSKNAAQLVLTDWPLTVEPIAFPMRKNDTRFRDLVNNALKTLYSHNEFMPIYNRWFNGEVKFPISSLMQDNLHRPSADPGLSLILGVQL